MKNIYFWMLTLLCSTLMFSGTNNFTFDTQTKGWSMFQTRAFGPDTAFKYDGNFNHVFYANTSATLAEFGDTCDAPIVVTSLPYTTTDNTSNYGDNYSSSDRPALAPGAVGNPSANYLGGDDVVYAYTPTSNQSIDISVSNHGAWTGLFVFTGCPFESTVGGHTDSSASTMLEVNGLDIQAGMTYYIVISTWPTPQSTSYTLNISAATFDCPALEVNFGSPCDDGNANTVSDSINENCECEGIPVATNDEPCTATALACGDSIEQSLAGATESLVDSCYGSGSSDVWFSFTTDGSQIMTVAETSSFDAVVQLFVGDDCGNLTEAGACKDGPENYTVTEAGTYYFRVRPYYESGNEGIITVGLTCVDYDCPSLQANIGDSCDDGNPDTFDDAVNENCECEGIIPPAGSVCESAIELECNAEPSTYSSVGSIATNTTSCSMGSNGLWFSFEGTGGDITINSSATFDHEMSIQTGSCDELVGIACIDSSIGTESYTIESTVANQMYYVYVAHWSSSSNTTGDISIGIECATPPACEAPTMTAYASDSVGEPIEGCLEFGEEYYVYATLSGGEGNTSYNVTANAGEPIEVDANDSAVLGPFTAGSNVNLMAVGAQDDDCSVSATVTSPALCAPSNDDCVDAEALVCGETITGSTVGATASGLPATCGGYTSSSALDLFYSFEADGVSDYTVSLDAAQGNTFDGILFIYSGACGELTSLGCSDSGNPEEMTLEAPDAGIYYVRIFRYSGSGEFTLGLNCIAPPACEAPTMTAYASDATGEPIEGCLELASEYYVYATLSGGEGNSSYNVTANAGDSIEVNANDSAIFGPFTLGTNVSLEAVGIQDAQCGASASVDSPSVCPPSNDNCEGAEMLTDGVSTAGTVAAATGSGIPANSCDGFTGTANDDVFYMFTATTAEGNLVLEDDFDGVIELWEGTCGALTFISCKDTGTDPTITFTDLTPGNVYYVRVFSYGSSEPSTPTFNLTYTSVQTFDCPELGANIGDACDDDDATTENDTINDNCECEGTPIVTFDCPELEANFGDACDDSDATTENDMINENCECEGTPIVTFDCPELEANFGDACDDDDDTTENDVVTEDCECVGTPIIVEPEFDCPSLQANIGDSCNDGDDTTENDVVTEDCECAGTPIIVEPEFDCPSLQANFGDSCNDGDDTTENDVVTEDCECAGTPVEQNDMDGDGFPDDIDNCPSVYNPDQADGNEDGIGDACEECDLPYMVVLNRTSPTTATFDAGNSVWHYQGSANRTGRPLRPYPMYGMNDMTVPHTQYALVPTFDYDVWIRTICDDGSFSPWAGPFFLPTFETGARRTPRMDITPNPAIAIVKISKVEAKTIEVFDMNGGHVKTFNTNDNQFDMTGLPTGKYNLRVIDAEGNIHYDQVIKK